MRVIYCQKQKAGFHHKILNSSGFICPFNIEDCMHMDSLSMTKTVNCNHCKVYIYGKKTDNNTNISN